MKKISIKIAKILLSVMLLGSYVPSNGQAIPNAGFENWINIGGWFDNPVSWNTNNNQITTPVVKDSNAHLGNFAVKVNRAGYAKARFSFLQHPTNVQLFAKSNITNGDTVNIRVLVYSAGNIVDAGNWINTVPMPNWTIQTIALSQNTTAIDSLEIQINGGKLAGTSLSVDDIMNGITGIRQFVEKKNFEIYPNPTTGSVILTNELSFREKIELYNALGALIFTSQIRDAKTEIDLSQQPNGIYFVKVGSTAKKIIKE